VSTNPLPMVVATAVPMRCAPNRFQKAAQTIACRGVSTLVETTVAMALALSLKTPLIYSKTNAASRTNRNRVMISPAQEYFSTI